MTLTQSQFRQALLDPETPVPDGLTDADARPAGRRFDVYRNNVAVSLTDALATGFPVIAKLLGDANFRPIAGVFLRQSPPMSPLVMHYGAEFPAFLAGFPPLGHLGYLADVARLELALRRSYHAADDAPIDPAQLGSLPPEALMSATLTLSSAVEVIRSPWPIHDIWWFNTEEGASKPRAVAQDVLITRPDFDPIPDVLPAGGAIFVEALRAGNSLGAAHEAAAAATEAFDLTPILALLIRGGAITSLNVKDPSQ